MKRPELVIVGDLRFCVFQRRYEHHPKIRIDNAMDFDSGGVELTEEQARALHKFLGEVFA